MLPQPIESHGNAGEAGRACSTTAGSVVSAFTCSSSGRTGAIAGTGTGSHAIAARVALEALRKCVERGIVHILHSFP